jgi:hypothetical protein
MQAMSVEIENEACCCNEVQMRRNTKVWERERDAPKRWRGKRNLFFSATLTCSRTPSSTNFPPLLFARLPYWLAMSSDEFELDERLQALRDEDGDVRDDVEARDAFGVSTSYLGRTLC